jgi:hypothetical protein
MMDHSTVMASHHAVFVCVLIPYMTVLMHGQGSGSMAKVPSCYNTMEPFMEYAVSFHPSTLWGLGLLVPLNSPETE